MAGVKPIIAFNAGEYSPLLEGRIDMDKYGMSCRTMENWRPTKYGAATKRPGTEYIAETKDSSKNARLFKFQFSTSTSYVIEAGINYFRFYESGAVVSVPSASAWLTSTAYVVGDLVEESSTIYYCLEAHTSGTFATDLAASKWVSLGTAGDPYEVASPWTNVEVGDIHYAQINDLVYFVHPDHPPYKLSRFADYYWTLEEVDWDFPALLDENVDDTLKITPSATTGTGITLTASSALFNGNHVGSYWYIEHRTKGSSIQLDISGSAGTTDTTGTTFRVKGDWQLTTSERWYGTLQVLRSATGAFAGEEEIIREFKSDSDRNVNVSGTESEKAYLALKYTAAGDPYGNPPFVKSGTGDVTYTYFEAQATLEAAEQFLGGFVKVTGYTSPTQVTATVKSDLEGTGATEFWAEGAWSDHRGHPRAVTLFEQRLVFASSDYQKQTMWFSQTDDYENFEKGSLDTDAMAYTLGAQEYNEILWLVPQSRLIIGTSGGEYAIGASDSNEPLTPTNVVVRRQSNFGSNSLQAKMVNDVVLFVQRQGRKVRELTYSFEKDGYVAPDLTILSEHITEGGITQIDYQQQPDAVFWAIRNDGTLLGMTYERQENVVGWFRYVTDGQFESVAVIYGDSADEVWVVVRRTINGATKRYVERFAVQDFSTAKADSIYMDSTLTFDGGDAEDIEGLTNARPAVVTITGHPFSNDQQVRITGTGVPEIDGEVCTVKNSTANTFELYSEDGADPKDLRTDGSVAITLSALDGGGTQHVFTVASHDFIVGDNVVAQTSGGGPGIPATTSATVTAVTATTVTVNISPLLPATPIPYVTVKLLSGATAYSSGGQAQRVENTFVNLSHLEGKEITALVDGATTPAKTVSGGAITLDDWGNVVHVGLPFTATLQPQKLALSTQTGSSIGKTLRISEVTLRLYKTLGINVGQNSAETRPVITRQTNDLMDSSAPLYSDDVKHYFRGGSDKSGDMVVISTDPLPATILGLFPKVEVTG